MDISTNPFEALEVDPIEGAEIMGLLNIDQSEFHDPVRFSRIKDVVNFLSGRPDKHYVVSSISKRGVDKIDHLWSYSLLRKNYESLTQELDKLKKELAFYE